jgi:hypothetical protein
MSLTVPPSRRRRLPFWWVAAVGIVLGLAFAAWVGDQPVSSVGGYSWELVALDTYGCPNPGSSTLASYPFYGAVFHIQVFYECGPTGSTVVVNGTEPHGDGFAITLSSRAINDHGEWYSPDRTVAVALESNGVMLFVLNSAGDGIRNSAL